MSDEEIRRRLKEYMLADEKLRKQTIAIEVRAQGTTGGRYQVLLIQEDGTETEVKFPDRYSRLIYIYALLHPKGFQRRSLEANNYQELRKLYCQIYLRDYDSLLNTIDRTDFNHFFSQSVSQSRKAIRQVAPSEEQLVIDRPQRHNGKTLIPFVQQGGTVIIDNSLSINN
ncbi:MAG: hypothetical protein IKX36_00810 [Prevotella sp.]|nr:hypothetical protein [Prevotella sp.]